MAGRDQYMNFFAMDVTSKADSSDVATDDFNTGAGMATLLAWRIHKLEFYSDGHWDGATNGHQFSLALSTRKDLAAVPELVDKGCIARMKHTLQLFGTPANTFESRWPHVMDYLPPIIVASPSFSLYFAATANFAGQVIKAQYLRIGFTTEKVTESLYREIFETWNYAN
jgi:phenylacetate-coenzyme A ligase PaaK-like adenylate-forming protein